MLVLCTPAGFDAYFEDLADLVLHGLDVELVRTRFDDDPGASFRGMLHTREAHGLSARPGFGPRTGNGCVEGARHG